MFEGLIRNGILTTVVVLIVSVLGIVAALRIPVQMIPDLEVRTVTVQTDWPGATPQDIEKEILIEQEEYLRNLPNLHRMVSRASSSEAEIELEFPYGVDMNETLIRVNNALSQVPSYPENVDQPRIYAASFSQNSFMYLRVAPLPGNPRGLNMTMMRDFVEDRVRTRMESVPGVSQVEVGGGAERQIQIHLDAERLAERNLSVPAVREAITARNQDVSGGDLESGKRRYLLRTIGRFEDLEDLRRMVLVRRGDAVIRLGEVAEVELGHFEMRERSYVNGNPVIRLSVNRETGSNVIDIKQALLPRIDVINREVLKPAGMELTLTTDDVRYVTASLANVWKNLAIGAVFATLVMFLFLRSGRATAVGVMGIPICAIAAFLGLLLAGRSINVISLAGVAFAIGMTLDNSIVVLESIELERRKGKGRFAAAVAGVQQVWPAVLASTMTTVLVFVPILFIEEEAGQLYSDVAIAISASILASMVVAITVLPTASARLRFGEKPQGETGSGLRRRTLRGVGALTRGATARFATIAATVVVSVGILYWLTPPAEYLPEGEEAKTFAAMNAPPGYNLETMTEIGEELHAEFLPHLDKAPAAYERGETEIPALAYFIMFVRPQQIFIITESKNPDHIFDLMDVIQEKYAQYPGMRAFASRGSIITSNEGGTRSINLDISGAELAPIYDAALSAYRRAEEIFDDPRIQANPSTLSLSQPLVEVHPDWDRTSELGMTAGELGFTVAALTDGAYVDEFFLADEKIDIFLYSGNGRDAGVDGLDQIPIHTPQGTVLPLSAMAEIRETVDTSEVRRINGQRTVSLNIIPPRDVALETGVDRVREEVIQHLRDRGAIPNTVSVDISGASDQLRETREALSANYLVAGALIYLLMVAIFRHWGYPLLIMTAIPLGVSGGILGLRLMNWVGGMLPAAGLNAIHQPFDMIAMLGFLILMGTVVNNPILIVHRAVENVRDAGMAAREAVAEAVESRLRPIAMSTITTICGLAPLVFLPGEGAELYRGVGAIVLFGILGAAVVSLTFLPALTVAVLRWRGRRTAGE
ncbi:efflux RND transporter permease subunit [Thiohalorhabdus sp. Cl-TMA]|uniref:Efflux RND transporter permease subunit n=1 Tax=Thiohalorhabdus methylotrophus TaxID=3242694 RepID=A0ABV4U081_9GAMM